MLVNVAGKDKRNFIKLKVLYYLSLFRGAGWSPVTIQVIAEHTGSNKRSLYTLLKRWVEWEYLEWAFDEATGNVIYRITPRGRAYLRGAKSWYARLDDVEREVFILNSVRCWWRSPDNVIHLAYYNALNDKIFGCVVAGPVTDKELPLLGKALRCSSIDNFKGEAISYLKANKPVVSGSR